MSESIVKLVNVNKSFKTGEQVQHVLKDINLEIHKGEIALIYGPSGSGKTTLLNQIGALDKPDSGEIYINGEPMMHKKEKELTKFRAKFVGWVFQFYNLIPSLTAMENVALALELSGDRKDMEQRSREMLKLVGLEDHADKFPSQLSGGQQQRVALARALVKRPPLVLGDEITGNLDSKTGKEVVESLKKLNEELNTTFLLISHDPSLEKYADHIFELKDGRIVDKEG